MSCPASISELPCAESWNPRRAGLCFRCDLVMPDTPSLLLRNLDLERQIVQNAIRGLNIDPSALIEHAQTRAHNLSSPYVADPMTIKPGLDRRREMREELVDFVNHALFHAQERPEEIDGECWHDVQILVRGAAVLYDRLLEDV